MQEYTYTDFTNTLDDMGKRVCDVIYNHITTHYPQYKPFDSRPTNKTGAQWLLAYRKRPKTGKAICGVDSADGKLTIRVPFLTSMGYEVLLRQNEFSPKAKSHILRQVICCVAKACRCYGENTPCPWRQRFWVNQHLVKGCPYPWIYFDWWTQQDAADICLLIDLQMKHMTQNAKDIKGTGYTEGIQARGGEVNLAELEQQELDVDDFEMSDYSNPKRLEKYAATYHLTPMGVGEGFWFYHDQKAVCGEGGNDYGHTILPKGRYAVVTIDDPLTFSVWRVWQYIAGGIDANNHKIRPVDVNDASVPYLAKFARKSGGECMTVYVPVV